MDTLGIIVCLDRGAPAFEKHALYKHCCLIGLQNGITVYVFSPLTIDWEQKQALGFTYKPQIKSWVKQRFPLPKLIYDRCFFKNRQQFLQYLPTLTKLRRQVRFLGNPLRGKWSVHKALSTRPEWRNYLPLTVPYDGIRRLVRWFKQHEQAFLKPQSGSQGRGVLHIARTSNNDANSHPRYIIRGRTTQNKPFTLLFTSSKACFFWVNHYIKRRRYILQQALRLTTKEGEPFDVRSLMQKNENGRWELVGVAVRKGIPHTITANIHGGGTAQPVLPFLTHLYGKQTASMLYEQIERLSYRLALQLEQFYGRLLELGIDFGIDQEGQLWVLEVNSKPGKTIFLHLRNFEQRRSSLRNPIRYARYILDRQLGG